MLIASISYAGNLSETYLGYRQFRGSGNRSLDPHFLNYQSIDGRIGGGLGTGNIFYVDSGVASEGDGSSWDNAFDTLQEGIDATTDNNGDVIHVREGTTGSVTESGTITCDKIGVTYYAHGEGDQRPTFTVSTAAAAKILITADDNYFYNFIFQSGKADLATAILVTARDAVFNTCTFRDSTSGLGMMTVGAADGDSDRFTLINCDFYQPGTTNDHSVEILFDMNNVRIVNNTFHGDYDEGVIYIPAGGNACLDLVIAGNIITQLQGSIFAININGTSTTGVIANNAVNATAAYESDPGGCAELTNSWQYDIAALTVEVHDMNTVDEARDVHLADMNALGILQDVEVDALTVTLTAQDVHLADTNALGLLRDVEIDALTVQTADMNALGLLRDVEIDALTVTLTAQDVHLADMNTVDVARDVWLADMNTVDEARDVVLAVLDAAALPSKGHPNYFVVDANLTDVTWNTVAAHEIAAVTGVCRLTIMAECVLDDDLVSGGTNATIILGFAGNTAAIWAAAAIDTWDITEVAMGVTGGVPTFPVGGGEGQSALTHVLFDVVAVGGIDVGYTLAVSAGTVGTIRWHIWWTPLSSDGAVTAGAGGGF